MKKVIKQLIFSKFAAKRLLKPMLKLHSLSYNFAGMYSGILNDNIHPKHQIMRYKEWFIDHIQKDWVVLDVGCNTGMMPEVMSEKADYIYGIEIVEKHIQSAKLKNIKKNVLSKKIRNKQH